MESSLYDSSFDLVDNQCSRLHDLVLQLLDSEYGPTLLFKVMPMLTYFLLAATTFSICRIALDMILDMIYPDGEEDGEKQKFRKLPPAHYLSKIESFSTLLETEMEQYVTNEFEAGGYKWQLVLDPQRDDNGSISLYLTMVETDDLPLGCDVNVKASFFLYDQIRDRYLVIEDSLGERRYHNMMSEWSVTNIISHDDLNESSNGFLVNDCIIFGVEIFVLNNTHKGESLSFIEEPGNGIFTWKIDNYSSDNNGYVSDVFDVEGIKWKLRLNSKEGGSNKEEGNLFLYLSLDDSETNPQLIYAKFTVRIMDQIKDNHIEKTGGGWFEDPSDWMRSPNILSLSYLKNTSNDYLVDNKLIIKAKINCIGVVKTF